MRVVATSGRPLGWSEPSARVWPVRAIVAESGALALMRDGARVLTEYVQDKATRRQNAQRLQAVAQQVLARVPGAGCRVPGAMLAQDSAGRATDIAIDHREFTRLPEGAIAHGVALMQDAGMNATVSSIHNNGWFGEHRKCSAAQWMLRRLFGRDSRLRSTLNRALPNPRTAPLGVQEHCRGAFGRRKCV